MDNGRSMQKCDDLLIFSLDNYPSGIEKGTLSYAIGRARDFNYLILGAGGTFLRD